MNDSDFLKKCMDVTCNSVQVEGNHLSCFAELIKRHLDDCGSPQLMRSQLGDCVSVSALLLAIKGSHWLTTQNVDRDGVFLYREKKAMLMEVKDSHCLCPPIPLSLTHYPSVQCFTCSS